MLFLKNIFQVITFLLIILFVQSCSKNELIYQSEYNKRINTFFKSKKLLDASTLRVQNHMLRLNSQKKFISDFIKKNGYPLWDNVYNKTNSKSLKRKLDITDFTNSEDTLLIIPIAIEGQEKISGFITAKLDALNVKLNLYRTKDYNIYTYNTNFDSINTDKATLQIMWLENLVYFHKKFLINDNNLFNESTSSSTSSRYIKVTRIKDLTDEGKFATIEICTTTQSSNGCSCWHHDFNQCDCNNPGCCWDENCVEIVIGGGDDTGGWNPTPNTGGTNNPEPTGGGPSPFPCPSSQIKSIPNPQDCDIQNPAPPPQVPPVTTVPDPLPTPCEKTLLLKNTNSIKQGFQQLKASVNIPNEIAITFTNSGQPLTYIGPTIQNDNAQVSIQPTTYIAGYLHTHPQIIPQPDPPICPMFSVGDLKTIYDLWKARDIANHPIIDFTTFTIGVTTGYGQSYFLTIDDPDKFLSFAEKWLEDEDQSELSRKFSYYNIEPENDAELNEKNFLEFIESLDMGASLLKANQDFSQYSQLKLSNTGNSLTSIQCP